MQSNSLAVFRIRDDRNFPDDSISSRPEHLFPNSIQVDGIFLNDFESVRIDQRRFHIRSGRNFKLSEVGIAMTHASIAKMFLQGSADFALVFESDARILDFNLVRQQIDAFQATKAHGKGRIGLLFHRIKIPIARVEQKPWQRISHVPSYAVAYIMDRSAAQDMLKSQEEIWSVADWPLCLHKVDYYVATQVSVLHLSETFPRSSHVGDEVRQLQDSKRRIWWLLGGKMLKLKIQGFEGIHIHWCFVLQPRIKRAIPIAKTRNQ